MTEWVRRKANKEHKLKSEDDKEQHWHPHLHPWAIQIFRSWRFSKSKKASWWGNNGYICAPNWTIQWQMGRPMDFKDTNQGNKSTNQHQVHYFGLVWSSICQWSCILGFSQWQNGGCQYPIQEKISQLVHSVLPILQKGLLYFYFGMLSQKPAVAIRGKKRLHWQMENGKWKIN